MMGLCSKRIGLFHLRAITKNVFDFTQSRKENTDSEHYYKFPAEIFSKI
jgi:hypothetical protein